MYWYEDSKQLRIREDYISAKIYNANGSFDKAIRIPSEVYETVGPVKLFSRKNCKRITDKKILSIFDKINYESGKCFVYSQKLFDELRAVGYDAKLYSGWLFVSNKTLPIIHSWVVLDGSVLDLSDNYDEFEKRFGYINASQGELVKHTRELLKLRNSERCNPVGLPYKEFLYVGSETTTENALALLRGLQLKFPDHEAFRKKRNDKTLMQTLIGD